MKRIAAVLALVGLLALPAAALAWSPLTVTGTCAHVWTVTGDKEDDNLVELSTDAAFTAPLELTLNANYQATATVNARQVWARWTNDHTVVTASGKLVCATPTTRPTPHATPPATSTQAATTANVENVGIVLLAVFVAYLLLSLFYIASTRGRRR